jgi:hypothetical protein
MAFKSHKISDMSVGKRKKKSDTAGFNPLRGEMPGRSESDGFGKEAVELVSEIRSIVKEFGESFGVFLLVQMLIEVCYNRLSN